MHIGWSAMFDNHLINRRPEMKMLVAYDGTLNSKEALSFGLSKARETGARLAVLSVFDPGPFAWYGAGPGALDVARKQWRAGLDVLAAAPFPFSSADGDRQALAKRLQQLAIDAKQLQATDQLRDRARAYGEILTTCAACHTGKGQKL